MIVERVLVDVRAGDECAFEQALQRAAEEVLFDAPGFRTFSAGRGIEHPSRYLLLIEWDRLEDHTVGFRESERFTRWRELIGPYFADTPAVEHYQPVAQRGR